MSNKKNLKIKLKNFLDVSSLGKAVILAHEVSQGEVSVDAGLFRQENRVVEFQQLAATHPLKI
jgi:hypothetical protein